MQSPSEFSESLEAAKGYRSYCVMQAKKEAYNRGKDIGRIEGISIALFVLAMVTVYLIATK